MKKRHLRFLLRAVSLLLALLAVFFPLLSLTSCRKKGRTKTIFGCFDTFATLTAYGATEEEEFEGYCRIAENLLNFYHRAADIYHEYAGEENLATLNRLAGKGSIALSDELLSLLLFSKEISEMTGGALNPMLGSVLSLWHDLRIEGVRLPTEEELKDRAAHTSIAALEIDEVQKTARITDSEASIDLGAIAKGYAAQRAGEALRAAGADSMVLNVGGNLVCIGAKPDGTPWTTGIKNPLPDAKEPYAATLELQDASLATTGGYERCYTVNGKNYHHVIDPETLFPGERYDSVSVLSEDSGISDALSTAFFLLSEEEAAETAAMVTARYGISPITVVYVKGESAKTVTFPAD